MNFFPFVRVLWANLRGGWVIGFVWLGVALVAELVMWAWDQDNPAYRTHVRRLAVITAASGLAVAATPHFLSLYPYPFQTEGSVAQQRLIADGFSPDFHQVFLRPFEPSVCLLLPCF